MRPALRILAALLVTLALSPLALLSAAFGRFGSVAVLGTHLWCRALCRILGVRFVVRGAPPTGPHLFVSNHLGYLDVLALGALYPTRFLSMAEVRGWPLVGVLASLVGTIFVDRSRVSDVGRAGDRMAQSLAAGTSVTFFPEGHTSRGEEVAPLKPALLEAAVRAKVPCVPVSLSYETPGSPEPPALTVCWWGGAPFASHLKGLLRLTAVEARVAFGEPVPAGTDRKRLAAVLRQRIAERLEPVRQGPE